MKVRVAAVIINYRTAELTAKVVNALLPELETVGPAHLYLIDNDSQDGSAASLRQAAATAGWGDRVTLIESPRNGGYGYGINVGVQAALRRERPDYVFILNSDAFVNPGSLKTLVAFLDGHPDVGIGGSPIYDLDGVHRVSAFRFPTALSELNVQAENRLIAQLLPDAIESLPLSVLPDIPHQAEWISGVGMLVRTAVFEQIGGFDEGFFLYFEEIDFCRRASRAGWKSYSVVTAPLTHIGSVSTGMDQEMRPMPAYWFTSRNRYLTKHHGRAYALLCDVAYASGVVLRRAKTTVLRRPAKERPRFLRDFIGSSVRNFLRAEAPGPDDCVIESRPAGGDGAKTEVDRRSPEQLALRELLTEDLATHGGSVFEPGFLAVAVHRFGKRAEAVQSPALRAVAEPAYKTASTLVDWVWGIRLPRTVQVGRRVRLWHYGCMVLQARSIGNDVHIRQCTTFGPLRGTSAEHAQLPVIEDGADLGSGACVMGPVTVGRNAMVGANTLVVKDVPAGSSVLGVPARAIPQFGLATRAPAASGGAE
jgi:GT2 family glycosyltransferase/serine acetyltransferase